jgi:hypothetical protein
MTVPALPPGKPREELLRYFRETWPKGMTVTSIKRTEWTPEADKEDDDDDDRDESQGGAPAIADRKPEEVSAPQFHSGSCVVKIQTEDGAHTATVMVIDITRQSWDRQKNGLGPGWTVISTHGRRVVALQLGVH